MEFSFRGFLDTLREHGELVEIARAVDLRSVAALVPQSEKGLYFSEVRGYSMPVASGLLQSRTRLALGLGVDYREIERKLRAAMDRPIAPRIVKQAPVKEVVLKGS
ncbi:MAG TPA: UbiD family decarboxylase, partial [Candidatus Binatia bacterium]